MPQSLLLLPALPAVQAADAEDHHQCQRYQGFHQGVAMFSVHGVEYAAAISPGATTENSFPGQIRKKALHTRQKDIFLRASTQLRPPQPPVAWGEGENNLLPVVTESAPIGWCEGHKKTGAIGRRLVISAGGLNRHRRFNARVRIVTFNLEVFKAVVEDRRRLAFDDQLRQRTRFAA